MLFSLVTAVGKKYQQPTERRFYTMDFANLVSAGVTLSQPSVSSTPAGLSFSGVSIAGVDLDKVGFWVEDGSNNVEYRVEVQVSGSDGSLLEGDGILQITDI